MKISRIRQNDQSGFTIIELLLAITFFSFILVFFSYGFVQINRTFQRGQTIKRVTQVGRLVIEDISRNIRLSSADPGDFQIRNKGVDGSLVNRLCLSNGTHYAWNTAADVISNDIEKYQKEGQPGVILAEPNFALVKTEAQRDACEDPVELIEGAVVQGEGDLEKITAGVSSLLDEDMVIQALDIVPVFDDQALRVDITISTVGALDSSVALSGEGTADATCTGYRNGGDQFCDVVRFSTIVNFRLP